jgi:CRP-like cAMP-binding protein
MRAPDVMTLQEVADYLGIKPESARRLLRRRQIAGVSGWLRSDIENLERTQGRRTDLKKDTP